MTTTIRRAGPDDLARIVEMGHRFLASVYAGRIGPPDPDRLAALAAWLLEDEQRALFVSESEAGLTGMIGLFLHPHAFTGELTATEMFWWVEPEARGHGLRLLQAAEAWARTAGAALLQMVAPDDAIERLYVRLGFQKVETSYRKELR